MTVIVGGLCMIIGAVMFLLLRKASASKKNTDIVTEIGTGAGAGAGAGAGMDVQRLEGALGEEVSAPYM